MRVTMDEIVRILLEAVPPESPKQYAPDVALTEAGLDSLDVSNFLLMIEETYDIKIPDEDLDTLNTLDEIVAYVNGKSAA